MTLGLQDFALSVSLDSGLLRQSIAAAEPVPPAEILSLAAAVQAIYLSVSLENRQLERIQDCRALWTETATLFAELCTSWTGVQSDDQAIGWLRNRLMHFRSLCEDRVGLYSITAAERQTFVNSQKGGSPPRIEKPAKEFSPKEMARVDAALTRRLHR